MTVSDILADLQDEWAALDAVVADLPDEAFALATPSPRWSVADQLAHLAYFDGTARLAIVDPEAFGAALHALLEAAAGGDEGVDAFVLGPYREMPPAELLAAWRAGRDALAEAAGTLGEKDRVPWYGPPMSAKSFLTARLMETWAHGQDVVDTVGTDRAATARLAHIARLGHLTRGWSYVNRRMEVPEGDVAVTLEAPDGSTWRFGESETDRITGSALDFCLVVTQRRNVADTGLVVEGDVATDWIRVAQAFAGPATDGPAPKGA